MERVYISSTVQDLSEYRRAVVDALRKCAYEVDSMEKYPARDDRPKAACEKDASECDIYVGIFAWRYGYIPTDDNPDARSITELEYLAAGRAHKPRLIFLLDDNVPWPPALQDAQQDEGGKRIRDLRTRLKAERWASLFRTPDDLTNQVMISVIQYRSTKTVEILSEIQNINDAKEFGPSYLPNIQQQINQPNSEFVALRLGPVPWWDTRLHLAAALTSDFTEIRQFILLDAERRYLTMASPAEIRRSLANSSLYLENLYYASRAQAVTLGPGEVDNIIRCYPGAVRETFPGQEEDQIKRVITPTSLLELGIRSQGEVLDLVGTDRWSNSDIVRRRVPYVVVMRNGILEGVIDRGELTSQIASQLLKM
jgi:hypothetical protein